MIEISKRLQTIGDMVKKGSIVADIGSDHAYLPTYLVQKRIALRCIAGEVNYGPWQAAVRQVQAAGLTDKIDVRLGDGLAVVALGEVDTICIAGMGGSLIASILEAGAEKLSGVSQLLLQPNVAAPIVRRWLLEHGFQLSREKILEEDGIIYEILEAVPGDPILPYRNRDKKLEDLLEIGPYLWEEKSPVLRKKLVQEQEKLKAVQHQLQYAKSPEAEHKKREVQKKLAWMEEMIACMQMDRE
ncbi:MULTISPECIES: tRNA (adenine(22)-N(1))-methyltransferase [Aneurinibacillus]|jgi:tRNA (adenine22-N1)-methyltransferase|uniref:tRNA (Adenine(22)-N(1))-methyltransferase TrmK n=1 Tax=Aneurinibacillus thermoaerophilus TaxID=143495 RepID=A0A1G7Z3K6_ANETH|nr:MULTISPECIES: tRNA (adenine(22)-N(1))-methyltransferase TrmK [Aneurinibacillus]AMA72375.1 SAM-dependent methyltransferase [Aneurinibacillus sp. XH2]MED0679717.1 tRNA (adenine(22)-N(1))-methyltransferase TrmK [Aneurinibacillus thermoaerophilus]MED0735748.1 tRNA (adenine(22)-N(1))-methyltransferase TrmK [Aneurinibacillus thermoaerophilus]MED0757956.1 tRNA (adenine(22)-N(1))-methyltransferase TrmK [Aneurinibacillus thermoaerophilus]MED0760137.1 tRNA (adenine(22)-N(1))-methyltransferase TrmK [A